MRDTVIDLYFPLLTHKEKVLDVKKLISGLLFFGLSLSAIADSRLHRVHLTSTGTNTFYINSYIKGHGKTTLLVDTGSGYSTINQSTLLGLQKNGHARFIRTLEGVMADGSKSIIPLYIISGIQLDNKCTLDNIEVAVFPNGAKEILGLNALKKLSPFIFSMDPPSLTLSNCSLESTANAQTDTIGNLAKN